jgi:hypothetical protein
MRKLKVRPTSHRQRISTESQFEARIAKILDKKKIFNYHVSERLYRGIPDRYVQGGRWIEFKQCTVTQKVTPGRFLSSPQERKLQEFYDAGDLPYVCVLFLFRLDPHRAILRPWETFQYDGYESWSIDKVNEEAYLEDDWEQMIDEQLTQKPIRC